MEGPRILALWAVPRSVSTAFERMMSARGDFTVFSEPFSAYYYFGPDRKNTRYPAEPPTDDHDPVKVYAKLANAAREQSVFFKDMAYHVDDIATPEFLATFTNTFLIRDPVYALPSLFRKMPDFTLEETGYDAVLRLYETVESITGAPPVVIDGEQLRAKPREVSEAYCEAVGIPFISEALRWERGEEQHWTHWKEWHDQAIQSDGFIAPKAEVDTETLAHPHVAEALRHCEGIYETLRARCIAA